MSFTDLVFLLDAITMLSCLIILLVIIVLLSYFVKHHYNLMAMQCVEYIFVFRNNSAGVGIDIVSQARLLPIPTSR